MTARASALAADMAGGVRRDAAPRQTVQEVAVAELREDPFGRRGVAAPSPVAP